MTTRYALQTPTGLHVVHRRKDSWYEGEQSLHLDPKLPEADVAAVYHATKHVPIISAVLVETTFKLMDSIIAEPVDGDSNKDEAVETAKAIKDYMTEHFNSLATTPLTIREFMRNTNEAFVRCSLGHWEHTVECLKAAHENLVELHNFHKMCINWDWDKEVA